MRPGQVGILSRTGGGYQQFLVTVEVGGPEDHTGGGLPPTHGVVDVLHTLYGQIRSEVRFHTVQVDACGHLLFGRLGIGAVHVKVILGLETADVVRIYRNVPLHLAAVQIYGVSGESAGDVHVHASVPFDGIQHVVVVRGTLVDTLDIQVDAYLYGVDDHGVADRHFVAFVVGDVIDDLADLLEVEGDITDVTGQVIGIAAELEIEEICSAARSGCEGTVVDHSGREVHRLKRYGHLRPHIQVIAGIDLSRGGDGINVSGLVVDDVIPHDVHARKLDVDVTLPREYIGTCIQLLVGNLGIIIPVEMIQSESVPGRGDLFIARLDEDESLGRVRYRIISAIQVDGVRRCGMIEP